MPDQGEIVLVPVPFTDLSSRKRRPVIVISNNDYNRTSPDIRASKKLPLQPDAPAKDYRPPSLARQAAMGGSFVPA